MAMTCCQGPAVMVGLSWSGKIPRLSRLSVTSRDRQAAQFSHQAEACVKHTSKRGCFSARFTYSFLLAFLARTLNQMGVPLNPKASRIWFSRNRSKLKCSLMSRSVNRMNVGGATAACVM